QKNGAPRRRRGAPLWFHGPGRGARAWALSPDPLTRLRVGAQPSLLAARRRGSRVRRSGGRARGSGVVRGLRRLRATAARREGPNRRHGREKRDNCDVLHDRFLLRGPERGRGRGLLCLRLRRAVNHATTRNAAEKGRTRDLWPPGPILG